MPLSTYLAPSNCDRNRPPPSQVACKLTLFAPPFTQLSHPFQLPRTPTTQRLTTTTLGLLRSCYAEHSCPSVVSQSSLDLSIHMSSVNHLGLFFHPSIASQSSSDLSIHLSLLVRHLSPDHPYVVSQSYFGLFFIPLSPVSHLSTCPSICRQSVILGPAHPSIAVSQTSLDLSVYLYGDLTIMS